MYLVVVEVIGKSNDKEILNIIGKEARITRYDYATFYELIRDDDDIDFWVDSVKTELKKIGIYTEISVYHVDDEPIIYEKIGTINWETIK